MHTENWMGIYRRWKKDDERALIRAYYADVPIDDMAKHLNRDSVEVVLRLIELRILGTDTLSLIWDDRLQRKSA